MVRCILSNKLISRNYGLFAHLGVLLTFLVTFATFAEAQEAGYTEPAAVQTKISKRTKKLVKRCGKRARKLQLRSDEFPGQLRKTKCRPVCRKFRSKRKPPPVFKQVQGETVLSAPVDHLRAIQVGCFAKAHSLADFGDFHADLNSDGCVDEKDLEQLQLSWGVCSTSCTADFNGSGKVDALDLTFLLSQWNTECSEEEQGDPDEDDPTDETSPPPPPVDPCDDSQESFDQGVCDIQKVKLLVPGFNEVTLPATSGETLVELSSALTVEHFKYKPIDETAPVLLPPATPYSDNLSDSFPNVPYFVEGLSNLNFDHYNNEFSFAGFHTRPMADYASVHGFSTLVNYANHSQNSSHLPEYVEWSRLIGGMTWWDKYIDGELVLEGHFTDLGIQEGYFEVIPYLPSEIADPYFASFHSAPGEANYTTLDLEHHFPDTLDELLDPDDGEFERFETLQNPAALAMLIDDFYEGILQSFTRHIDAARNLGNNQVGVYGWEPFRRKWFGLESSNPDPATDEAWALFGQSLYQALDILYPSVYTFYWNRSNVAYTLANIEFNERFVNYAESIGLSKLPMKPYYMMVQHGGGGGVRWWKDLPVPNEDSRAMIAAAFFQDISGVVTWNWSATTNPHIITVEEDRYYNIGKEYSLPEPFTGTPIFGLEGLRRYDSVYVVGVDEAEGMAIVQVVDPLIGNAGVDDDSAKYLIPLSDLEEMARPMSEPYQGVFEAMTLIKPFEYLLKNAHERAYDIPGTVMFQDEVGRVVRRVRYGDYHILFAYCPIAIHFPDLTEDPALYKTVCTIELENFDGVEGRTLRLESDLQSRIYVLKESAPSD